MLRVCCPSHDLIPSLAVCFCCHSILFQQFYCDAVTPGSSAAASGLQIGMMLEKVNRTRVSGYAPAQVAEMLTGMEGSMVISPSFPPSRPV